MANKKATKTKSKTRSTKATRLTIDEQYMGTEPGPDYFDSENKAGKKRNLHDYFGWYNYFYDRKKVNQVIISYAKKSGYKNASKFSKMFLSTGVAAVITGLENGVRFPEHKDYLGEEGSAGYQKWLHAQLSGINKKAQTLQTVDLDTDKIVEKKRPSVQENITNKGQELLGEIDHAIDVWDVEEFDMYKYLAFNKVSAAVANSIVNEYDGMIAEVKEARDGTCDQLKEAYNHMTKGDKDDFYNFLTKIKTDTTRYVEMNKPVRKPKKPKQFSAAKIVSKLSYMIEDPENKVKSVEPSQIVGAKQLWIFNSKTNEMIKYDAEDRGGLTVVGTTLKNFNPKTSMSKKLGMKTEHFIDRVLDGGTIVLNKCMSEINSKSSIVTGRINNNMIILKVD